MNLFQIELVVHKILSPLPVTVLVHVLLARRHRSSVVIDGPFLSATATAPCLSTKSLLSVSRILGLGWSQLGFAWVLLGSYTRVLLGSASISFTQWWWPVQTTGGSHWLVEVISPVVAGECLARGWGGSLGCSSVKVKDNVLVMCLTQNHSTKNIWTWRRGMWNSYWSSIQDSS